MRLSLVGWYVAYILLCVYAHPVKEQTDNADTKSTEQSDIVLEASSYILEATSSESSEDVASELEDLRERVIPIKGATTAKNDFVLLPLTLEPDAEMLPLNYKGVKPPGVDHMELISLEPQEMASDLKVSQTSATGEVYGKSGGYEQGRNYRVDAGKHEAQNTNDKGGGNKSVNFESRLKGTSKKEGKKGRYLEKGGKKKSLFEKDGDAGYYSDEGGGKGGSSYHFGAGHDDDRKSKGFRQEYHKDERKKNADFYDNGHKGGRFLKHGHYDEKYTSNEGSFKKGKSHTAEYDEVMGKKKKGHFEEGHNNRDAKGHKAEQGHDSYIKKYDEHDKKGATNHGKKHGYQKGRSEKSN